MGLALGVYLSTSMLLAPEELTVLKGLLEGRVNADEPAAEANEWECA